VSYSEKASRKVEFLSRLKQKSQKREFSDKKMAEKYAEMDHKEYAKLVMAPCDQNLIQKIVNFAKGMVFSVVLVLTGITG